MSVVYRTIAECVDTVGDGISFRAGEQVEVLVKSDDAWWYVQIGEREGWTLAAYIKEFPSGGPHTPSRTQRQVPASQARSKGQSSSDNNTGWQPRSQNKANGSPLIEDKRSSREYKPLPLPHGSAGTEARPSAPPEGPKAVITKTKATKTSPIPKLPQRPPVSKVEKQQSPKVVQKPPSAHQCSKAPQTGKLQQESPSYNTRHAPRIPNVPPAPPIPNIPKSHPIQNSPKSPPIPNSPKFPPIPNSPKAPPIPNIPKSPPIPNSPKTPKTQYIPTAPPVPNIPKAPPVPAIPKTPSTHINPKSHPIPNIPKAHPISNNRNSPPIPNIQTASSAHNNPMSPPIPNIPKAHPTPNNRNSPPIPDIPKAHPIPNNRNSPPIPHIPKASPIPYIPKAPPAPPSRLAPNAPKHLDNTATCFVFPSPRERNASTTDTSVPWSNRQRREESPSRVSPDTAASDVGKTKPASESSESAKPSPGTAQALKAMFESNQGRSQNVSKSTVTEKKQCSSIPNTDSLSKRMVSFESEQKTDLSPGHLRTKTQRDSSSNPITRTPSSGTTSPSDVVSASATADTDRLGSVPSPGTAHAIKSMFESQQGPGSSPSNSSGNEASKCPDRLELSEHLAARKAKFEAKQGQEPEQTRHKHGHHTGDRTSGGSPTVATGTVDSRTGPSDSYNATGRKMSFQDITNVVKAMFDSRQDTVHEEIPIKHTSSDSAMNPSTKHPSAKGIGRSESLSVQPSWKSPPRMKDSSGGRSFSPQRYADRPLPPQPVDTGDYEEPASSPNVYSNIYTLPPSEPAPPAPRTNTVHQDNAGPRRPGFADRGPSHSDTRPCNIVRPNAFSQTMEPGVLDQGVDTCKPGRRYRAKADFSRETDVELSLRAGMEVEVLERTGDWWYVSHNELNKGWVPAQFLER